MSKILNVVANVVETVHNKVEDIAAAIAGGAEAEVADIEAGFKTVDDWAKGIKKEFTWSSDVSGPVYNFSENGSRWTEKKDGKYTWSNFTSNESASPQQRVMIQKKADIPLHLEAAFKAGHTVRMVGGGYCFNALALSQSVMFDMSPLKGLIKYDGKNKRITVESGIPINDIEIILDNKAKEFKTKRLCLPTTTIFPALTIGGVIGVAGHGSGKRVQTMSDYVTEFTVFTVNEEGKAVERTFSSSNPEHATYMRALKTHLGSLGVIYSVTIQLVDQYVCAVVDDIIPFPKHLKYKSNPTKKEMEEWLLKDIVSQVSQHDGVEIYWWPFTNSMWVRKWDEVDAPADEDANLRFKLTTDFFLAFTTLGTPIVDLTTKFPWLAPVTTNLGLVFAPDKTKRNYPLQYIEHYLNGKYMPPYPLGAGIRCPSIPADGADPQNWDFSSIADSLATVITDCFAETRAGRYPLNAALHCRFIKATDAYLAPNNYGPDNMDDLCAQIEIVSFENTPLWMEFFQKQQENWIKKGALPHWGKIILTPPTRPNLNNLGAMDQFKNYFENLAQFEKVREKMDPNDLFVNDFMNTLMNDSKKGDIRVASVKVSNAVMSSAFKQIYQEFWSLVLNEKWSVVVQTGLETKQSGPCKDATCEAVIGDIRLTHFLSVTLMRGTHAIAWGTYFFTNDTIKQGETKKVTVKLISPAIGEHTVDLEFQAKNFRFPATVEERVSRKRRQMEEDSSSSSSSSSGSSKRR